MSKHLNEDEKRVKSFLESVFIPSLHEILQSKDPAKYAIYQGAACRQTATIGYFYVKELLPEYEWEAWEADFKDVIMGKPVNYDHAWLYGKSKSRKNKDLLVDLARNNQERLFIKTNKNQYPTDHPEYKDTVILSKKRMNPVKNLEIVEFYTEDVGKKLLKEVEFRCAMKTLALAVEGNFLTS